MSKKKKCNYLDCDYVCLRLGMCKYGRDIKQESSKDLVFCSICHTRMNSWEMCEDTNHCSYYDEGDVGYGGS